MSMFGALNRFIARLDAEPQKKDAESQSGFGFQVLRNSNDDLAIEPWFDFIVGINGRPIDNGDPGLFATEIRNLVGANVEFGLWSAKGQRTRSIYATVPADQAALGLSLQWVPLAASEDVWHVLDVTANSPADLAGLLPYGDYIIGSPEGIMRGETGLGEMVEHYISKPMRLHVYNHEYNVTRLVTIEPSRNWGGQGALGCVLGYGALHRIPSPLDEPPQGPGETMFEMGRPSVEGPSDETQGKNLASQGEPQYLVPADMKLPTTGQGGAGGGGRNKAAATGRKGRTQHHGAPMDMDAFFQEGEEKSKEQDYTPSPKPGASSIAPPPKAGQGPPKAASPTPAAAPSTEEKSKEDA